MRSSIISAVLTFAVAVSGHGVILGADGEPGSKTSVGFAVNDEVARNCTGISPCQQDTTIIRDAEIAAKTTGECGRTQLVGPLDATKETEAAIKSGEITEVKGGTVMAVLIHQVNADGAGPYFCDVDFGADTGIISQQLVVTNNVPGANGFSPAKFEAFTINVAMPNDFQCTGGSTKDICTVRCRNNALAGPFGGCFSVRQVDGAGGDNNNNNGGNNGDNNNNGQNNAQAKGQGQKNGQDKNQDKNAQNKNNNNNNNQKNNRSLSLKWARRALGF